MALMFSKKLCLYLSKHGKKNIFPALGNGFLSVMHYSDVTEPAREKISKAMKAYLERSTRMDKFMKQQLEEYELGKKFLQKMMGKTKEMTESEVDEAIDYLLPSALFVPKSRPMMKKPQEIFRKQKEVFFDNTGRPFHFLFYTSKPNYNQCLHDAAVFLQELNCKQAKLETPPGQLIMPPGNWFSKEELEKIFLEKLYDIEYEKFIEVFTKLLEHKYALLNEAFLRQYWKVSKSAEDFNVPECVLQEDGTKVASVGGLRKKHSKGSVTVKNPGTGIIRINNLGLDYFENVQRREQIIFPLILTDMLGKVDITATVEGGGDASQAAAIRLGVSKALTSMVPQNMIQRLKFAGLLQRDIRRRERKKPGKEGARRSYTWLKR